MSFFGFDTTLPKNDGHASNAGIEEEGYSRIDELMEEKLKFGDEQPDLDGELGDDVDASMDAETFGDTEIGKDFDFTAGNSFFNETSADLARPTPGRTSNESPRRPAPSDAPVESKDQPVPSVRPFMPIQQTSHNAPQQPPQQPSSQPAANKFMSMEELESRMQQQQQGRPAPARPSLSLAEIEAQMMSQNITSYRPPHMNSSNNSMPPMGAMMQDPRRPMSIEQVEAALRNGQVPSQSMRPPSQQQSQQQQVMTVEEIEARMRSAAGGGRPNMNIPRGMPIQGMPMMPGMAPGMMPQRFMTAPDGRPIIGPDGRPIPMSIGDGRPMMNVGPDLRPMPMHIGPDGRPMPFPPNGQPPFIPGPNMRPPVPPVLEVEGVLRALASSNLPPNPRELDILLASQRYIDPTPAEDDVARRARAILNRLPPGMLDAFFRPPPQHFNNMRGGGPPQLQQRPQQQHGPNGFQQRPQYRPYRDERTREERYNNLMTQYEKETIAKIQISQLVTESPYEDDFYYQVFRDLLSEKQAMRDVEQSPKDVTAWQQALLMKQSSAGTGVLSQEMQSQMKRLIESRKQKSKATTFEREGALGKISVTSVRQPRQALQVQGSLVNLHKSSEPNRSATLSRRRVLLEVERIYTVVLKLEQLQREDQDNPVWEEDFKDAVEELWLVLGCSEPVDVSLPHPFVSYLSVTKGKRILPRVMRFLSPDQILTLVGTLLVRAESVDVFSVPLGTASDAVTVFMNESIPAIMNFVLQISLPVLNALVRSMLERHTVTWIVGSRVGLAFLTMFLSRAEMLKQEQASEADTANWTELYNYTFGSLVSRFASLFPPSSTDKATEQAEDEDCVWQFLASLAVAAATTDHQRQLVTEVRDKVREAAGGEHEASVDMFLSALGLGVTATQLAAMG
ncbi:hypothetical protein SmJEL517_g02171 [Synchytrium microbalum]|uniref:mRNA decay factor PAT1 domain-containing protein n=1 Tax=Synchytrium microbalum TaxID=1806994 RepID=A0A507CD82_9FUNG|nr:uncharacterized protein SmJEL517_g02171 [Synchytrium microbalum]TPX35493.1 hypothetical protein SmJEL517_g02171 [Synchytrium microbalum]